MFIPSDSIFVPYKITQKPPFCFAFLSMKVDSFVLWFYRFFSLHLISYSFVVLKAISTRSSSITCWPWDFPRIFLPWCWRSHHFHVPIDSKLLNRFDCSENVQESEKSTTPNFHDVLRAIALHDWEYDRSTFLRAAFVSCACLLRADDHWVRAGLFDAAKYSLTDGTALAIDEMAIIKVIKYDVIYFRQLIDVSSLIFILSVGFGNLFGSLLAGNIYHFFGGDVNANMHP